LIFPSVGDEPFSNMAMLAVLIAWVGDGR